MYINSVRLINFRNYESEQIEGLSPGINLICGSNAQGKTNLIEAIYICAQGRSFRTSSDMKVIKEGCGKAYIKTVYTQDGGENTLETLIQKNRAKSYKKNGIPLKNSRQMLGNLLTVVFSPEDIRTVSDAPHMRRALLDAEISKIRPSYVDALKKYAAIIDCKNAVLKDNDKNTADILRAYNERLKDYISIIVKNRLAYSEKLNEIMAETHYMLSGGRENIEIVYRPAIVPENVGAQLEALVKKETDDRTVNKGPHRDPLDIRINGREARAYASQGQLRTIMLALKIACVKILEENTYKRPVLLLDDVFSELDAARRKNLTDSLNGIQTFITACADKDELNLAADAVIKVENGRAVVV